MHAARSAHEADAEALKSGDGVAFVVYPTVVYAAFAAFNCRALRLEPPVSVLLDDDRVRCEGSRHRLLQAASLAVIAAVALLVFGPKRLPEFGRTLGKTLKGFQSASKEFEREINKAMADPEPEGDQAKALEAPAETVVTPVVSPKSEPTSPSD